MKMRNFAWLVSLGLLGLFLSAAGNRGDVTGMNVPEKHEVITFSTGSAALTDADQTKLRTALTTPEGKIKEVRIVAWSDKPFPATEKGEKAVNRNDRNLAEKRAENVRDFVKKSFNVSEIKIHNMAEREGAIARMFGTTEADLKAVFEGKEEKAKQHEAGRKKESSRYKRSSKGRAAKEKRKPARRSSGREAAESIPIRGYEGLSAKKVMEELPSLSRGEIREIKEYEKKHKKRASLMREIEKALKKTS